MKLNTNNFKEVDDNYIGKPIESLSASQNKHYISP